MLSRSQDSLTNQEKAKLVRQITCKKNGTIDMDWAEICSQFDLNINAETLRKAGVGIKFASDAGMISDPVSSVMNTQSEGYLERQKIRDQTSKVREIYRAESRSELIRETIAKAIKDLPSIEVTCAPYDGCFSRDRELVLAIGDIHYGASIRVDGLNGEVLNEFNHEVFEVRMEKLLDEVFDILDKERHVSPPIERVHVFFVGDLLDGMIRQSQLMRLEYGQVESTMRLSEYLSQWLNTLSRYVPFIDVYAATGNHSEIRPLKSKKREFEDENMERIVLWYLSERLRECERITIHDECKKMVKAEVCGYSFLLLHGDSDKDIQDYAAETIRLYKTPIDYFVCGHKHREADLPSGTSPTGDSVIVRVPSICGVDRYASSKGYNGKAGATVQIMEKGYGRRCIYPIILQ